MKTAIDLLTSKKFLAAIVAIAVYGGGRVLGLDPSTLDHIFAALLVYVGAQGVADVGKGAAQVNAAERATIRAGGPVDTVGWGPRPSLEAAPPARKPEGGRVGLTVAVLIATIGLFCWACATVHPPLTAGAGAFLDCESPPIASALGDLLPIGKAAVKRLISGTGQIDTTALRADMAEIKSDLGRCLEAAAIAALSSEVPGAGVAGPTVDGTQALAAFATARASLGWAPVRLAGGQVL